jgi:uncharacterized DUF497 family protein
MREFEWDEDKAEANLRKHGVSFGDAQLVFLDPFRQTRFDKRRDYGEERLQTIGMVEGKCLLLFVAWTIRESGAEVIRIISARYANSKERRRYGDRTF